LERSACDKLRELHAGIGSELLEDMANMSIDSVRGDEELVSDLPVGAPMRGEIGDHGLGLGQCLPPGYLRVPTLALPRFPDPSQ
jgi:hypothetical protein